MPGEHSMYLPPGARVRELRTGADMAQAALAAEMARRGFRWHQTTVTRIEAGARHLAIEEAAAIADIFAVPIGSLAAAGAAS